MTASACQLEAIARVDDLFRRLGIEYWLFGGWAVDFHAGFETRQHDDVDVATWRTSFARVGSALTEDGWEPRDADASQGIAAYERDTALAAPSARAPTLELMND